MAEYVRKSTLRVLEFCIKMPRPSDEHQVSEEEAIDWYQRLEVGGKEFILSLEDRHFDTFSLPASSLSTLSFNDLESQTSTSLKAVALSVNSARNMKNLPDITFNFFDVWR